VRSRSRCIPYSPGVRQITRPLGFADRLATCRIPERLVSANPTGAVAISMPHN